MLVALCIARCHGTASSCLEPSSPVCPGWGAARREQHPGTVPSSRLGPSRKQRRLHCLGSFCPFANRGPAEALNLHWLQMEETKIRAFSGTSRNEGNFPKRSNPSTSGPRYQTKTKARMKMHKITSGFPKYNKRVKHLHASYTLTVWDHPCLGTFCCTGRTFPDLHCHCWANLQWNGRLQMATAITRKNIAPPPAFSSLSTHFGFLFPRTRCEPEIPHSSISFSGPPAHQI